MSKKQGKLLLSALIGTFVLLAAGLIVFLVLWLSTGKEAHRQAAELEALQSEMKALETRCVDLQTQLDEALEARKSAESALEETREALKTAEAELDAAESEEMPEKEPLDVRTLEAGSIVAADEIDMEQLAEYFQSCPIEEGDAVYQRIYGRSYVDNSNIGLDDLRYFKVLHYNFDHEIQVGELIANRALEQDYLEIFRELFENEYEIASMYLIDNYWTGDGDSSDTASIEVNNTSAFCYRAVTGGSNLSNHAYGRALDINPQQNPYVSYSSGYPKWSHSNADDYIDRTTGYDHVITHEDLCYQIFIEHGFTWGGDWDNPKDYQHFEKKG